jgi:hypothetical protein
VSDADAKGDLLHYLKVAREALLWKLDGCDEYDVRRPLVRSGTNLLGLVKHLAGVEAGYLGEVFGRPFPEPLPWMDADDPNADMFATADESRDDLVALYRRVWAHGDGTVNSLDLDATGTVPWWPAHLRHPTLHRVLIHVATEVHRHVGHADLCRELIDGAIGHRAGVDNLPEVDDAWWVQHHSHVEAVARQAAWGDVPTTTDGG